MWINDSFMNHSGGNAGVFHAAVNKDLFADEQKCLRFLMTSGMVPGNFNGPAGNLNKNKQLRVVLWFV